MAKRKSVTTERVGDAMTARPRRGSARLAQDALPGLGASDALMESATAATLVAAPRRPRRRAKAEVTLQLAPTNGPRQSARQKPAATPAVTSAQDTAPATTATPTPKRIRKSGSQRFGDLRAALADGWEIVQPIFARPLWSATDDSQTAFNFVLRREQATRLLTVPGNRTVERFIETRSLKVDYRR